jgi:predicted nucleic acid-binding protein
VIALDSSVAIPALVSWHEFHEPARVAAEGAFIPAHALLETYSVLTKSPNRLSPSDAGRLIAGRFGTDLRLVPSTHLAETAFERAAAVGLQGGAVYDVLIGWTAAEHGATLISLDRRATANYEAADIPVEYLATP